MLLHQQQLHIGGTVKHASNQRNTSEKFHRQCIACEKKKKEKIRKNEGKEGVRGLMHTPMIEAS